MARACCPLLWYCPVIVAGGGAIVSVLTVVLLPRHWAERYPSGRIPSFTGTPPSP